MYNRNKGRALQPAQRPGEKFGNLFLPQRLTKMRIHWTMSRAEQSRAEQSRAEQSRAEQSRS